MCIFVSLWPGGKAINPSQVHAQSCSSAELRQGGWDLTCCMSLWGMCVENHLTCRFWVIEGLELRAATIRDIEEKKLGVGL